MGNLYVMSGGGLGDFIYNYFNSYEWQALPTINKFFGDANVIAVSCHHSPTAAELIYTNPHINSILVYPWYPPGHIKEYEWRKLIRGESLDAWGKKNKIKIGEEHGLAHKLWLTQEEEKLVNEIKSRGPFVVMHPFAGLPHRGSKPHPYDGKYKCYPDYKYAETAEYLYSKGINVVVVGRTTHDGVDVLRNNPEEFNASPNIINLVNKTSVRVQVELARTANGFIGAHSSMLSAAWTGNTPSIFFYPAYDEHGNYMNVREHGGTTGTWALDKPYNKYYELSAEQYLNLNPVEPAERLLEILR